MRFDNECGGGGLKVTANGDLELSQGKVQPAKVHIDNEEDDDRVILSEYMKYKQKIDEEADTAWKRCDDTFDPFGFNTKDMKISKQ